MKHFGSLLHFKLLNLILILGFLKFLGGVLLCFIIIY
jgi:hypothetical protein